MADMESGPAGTKPFSKLEEEFFRAGDEMKGAEFEEDPPPARKTLWSRLFALLLG